MVTVVGYDCSGAHPSVTVTYSRGSAKASIIHSYSDAAARQTCAISRTLRSGSLKARWGSMLRVAVRFTHAGGAVRPTATRGCRSRGGLARRGLAAGTIALDIHSKVFGRIRARRATVELTRAGSLRCSPPPRQLNLQVADGTSFNTFANVTSLFASQPLRGRRSVSISANADNPGSGVSGSVTATFEGGASLFSASPKLTSAHVGAAKPLLTGSLSFRGLAACPGSPNAVNGTVSGALVLHDPVVGKITVGGAHILAASLTRGSATPGQCNGPGAVAPQAMFSDTSGCDVQGSCSVSGGTNTVTFQDYSSPGTAQITGESWDFGDGSPPVPGPVGGQVQHTYSAPGTYTATLTITASTGQTYTSTDTVYIGS